MEPSTIAQTEEQTVWKRMLSLTTTGEAAETAARREDVLKNDRGQYLLWKAEIDIAEGPWQDWQPAAIEFTTLDETELADWYEEAYDQDGFEVCATDDLIEEIALELGEPLNIHVVTDDAESGYPSPAARYPDSYSRFATWLAAEQAELAEQLDALRQELLAGSLEERTVTDAQLSLGHLERAVASLEDVEGATDD